MSNAAILKTIEKPRLSIKAQTMAAIAAAAGAVALPWIFHALGIISGLGTIPGEVFLPMHLPIILTGLLAGPYAGAAAGLSGPLLGFAISGMPEIVMLPFMMTELCIFGLSAGFLRKAKMATFAKVIAVQIMGRTARAAALLFAIYILGNDSLNISVIWSSISRGSFGIALQWVLIPLIVYRMESLEFENVKK